MAKSDTEFTDDPLARIAWLAKNDGRYTPEAFYFVSDAVRHTADWLKSGELTANDVGKTRGDDDEEFHVSGQELLAGIRMLAIKRWGSMARHVLAHWGIRSCEDIGEIVFLMVEDPQMGWRRRECDTREDFHHGYDFATAFDDWDE